MNNKFDWEQYAENTQPQESPNSIDWEKYAESSHPYWESFRKGLKWESAPEETIQPTTWYGAMLRAAGRAPYDIAEKLGVPHENLAYPGFVRERPYDIQHAPAEIIGQMFSPIGGYGLKTLAQAGFKGLAMLPFLSSLKTNISEENLNAAEENLNAAEQAEKNYKDKLKSSISGKSEIPSLKRAVQTLESQEGQLQSKYPGMPNLSSLEEINLKNRLPGATGEQLIPQAQQATRIAEKEIGQYLGAQQPNDVTFQNIMNQMIRGGRAQLSQGYDTLHESMANKNVSAPRTQDLTDIQDNLRHLISTGRLESPEARSLAEQLNQQNNNKSVPASDILTQFRTADKLAKIAFKKAYSRNESLTPEQRENFLSQAQQYRDQAFNLQNFLEQNVDENFLPKLQELNQGWRQYASLYKNPLARKIESGRGISGSNILEQMRGEDIGQQLLRNLTQSHPEALRAALGHSFAQQPRNLLNPSQYEQGFINQNPNLTGMIDRLRSALQGEEIASLQTQARRDEAQRVQRAYQEDVKLEQDKALARQLAQEKQQYEEQIKELEKLANNKKLSQEERLRASLELEQQQQKINKIKLIAKRIAQFIAFETLDSATKSTFKSLFK